MPPSITERADRVTKRVVFWIFFSFVFSLLVLVWISGVYFDDKLKDLVMIHLFLYGALSALFGGKIGGYLGAVMEEDTCAKLDMGVLSSMGSLAVNLAFPLIGTALVGASFVYRWDYLWALTLVISCGLFILINRTTIAITRTQSIDCCGWRVDSQGRRLPFEKQPMRMKNRLAIVLGVSGVIFCALTVYMAVLMRNTLWSGEMLGAMMYAMSGAGLGGMVSGWLAGLLDEHTGEPEHDNPIMISAMSLMASMMGAMPASMLGGMMALMGPKAIVPTVVSGTALLCGYYFFFFRGHFKMSFAFGRIPVKSAVEEVLISPQLVTSTQSQMITDSLTSPAIQGQWQEEFATTSQIREPRQLEAP